MPRDRRATEYIVIHCAATPPVMDPTLKEIDRWHRAKGIQSERLNSLSGYHVLIRRNGSIELGRDVMEIGAHCIGINNRSFGICLNGGIDADGNPESNFTDAQWRSLSWILDLVGRAFPWAKITGHNEWAPKACPSFDVAEWLDSQREEEED